MCKERCLQTGGPDIYSQARVFHDRYYTSKTIEKPSRPRYHACMKRTIPVIVILLLIAPAILTALGQQETASPDHYRIGVFVPGVVDGSPTYEMLVAGTERAASEVEHTTVTVVEGGFNQATWEENLMSMAASNRYDLIVTSNPSMPELAEAVARTVPGVQFLILDGYLEGNDRIHTILFNQREQAFLAGYFAGLVTTSPMPGARPQRRIGLLAGQEYPIMNDVILVGYREGAQAVDSTIEVDFRVLGNWFDAGQAQEIATDMMALGADIILAIAGGGNQGVVSAARERGGYVIWYDDSGYDEGPGIVAGSTVVRQDEATYVAVAEAIQGETPWGSAIILGVADGAVGFDMEHQEFQRTVPREIANRMETILTELREGVRELPVNLTGR